MNEEQVKQSVATATTRLATRFERFVEENRAFLTEETERQLSQVIGDLQSMAKLLGVDSDQLSVSEADTLGESLKSYAGEFTDKSEYLRHVNELAEKQFGSAKDA